MKILTIKTNYASEVSGIGKYSSELVEWFASKGHEVRFALLPKLAGTGRLPPPSAAMKKRASARSVATKMLPLVSNWLATERVRLRGKAYATTHLSEDRIVCAFERRVVIDLQKEREILNEP
jgi:hypothetical protein